MKLGFTVGVFDLLHEGHQNLLKRACSLCDYLIVGVATDWLTRVQKGHDRPSQSYEVRALAVERFLRTLPKMGRVIEIDTLDMTPYLQMVDVWVVGENQRNMRPFQWGAQVRIPETPGVSTTLLLQREKAS